MVKLVVLYKHPDDPEEFERHYKSIHLPLGRELPGLVGFETARVIGGPDGSKAPYHRIAELQFESVEAIQSSLQSEQGKATSRDMRTLATGGADVIVCEMDEESSS